MSTRHILITTGATAPFPALVAAGLTPSFLAFLSANSFTHIHLQHSTTPLPPIPQDAPSELKIDLFDFTDDLAELLRGCEVVVTHAGAGTVLEAMRFGKRLVVVPNPELMGGHQEELAEEVEKGGWGVWGRIDGDRGGLEKAVDKALNMVLGKRRRDGNGKAKGQLAEEVEREMGLGVE